VRSRPAIPLLYLIDGFWDRIEILYSPGFSFTAGPDLALQIAGIVISAVGLAILIVLGRKLAARVYAVAAHERELITTGLHRYVQHPFYLHFVLLTRPGESSAAPTWRGSRSASAAC
jgi:hypothetical protein